jgi:hypothetical protein
MKMTILQGDATTPFLKELQSSLKPGSAASLKLRKGIAGRLEQVTRSHITKASLTRHKTATRLSAKPTGYLEKKEGTVESQVTGNADGLIQISVYGDIFARVDGPVSVKPRTKKWLAIPATAEAYGKRPYEIDGLRFVLMKKGKLAALVRVKGTDGKPKSEVIFWLKKGVTLPQDRGLLPSEQQYLDAMEMAANDFMTALAAQEARKGFGSGGRNSRV